MSLLGANSNSLNKIAGGLIEVWTRGRHVRMLGRYRENRPGISSRILSWAAYIMCANGPLDKTDGVFAPYNDGSIIAIYPLPWGMANQDEITPAFEYMPSLENDVTILMGAADHLAGPDIIRKMQDIVAGNSHLTMHLCEGSNHGFFTDIDGDDENLMGNAKAAIDQVNGILF